MSQPFASHPFTTFPIPKYATSPPLQMTTKLFRASFHCRHILLLLCPISLLILLLLFHPPFSSSFLIARLHHFFLPPPLCPHSILFSQVRHGSTWFVNNLEQCRFSSANDTLFIHSIFLTTELWHTSPRAKYSMLNDSILAADASHYVRSNSSVKLFPTAMRFPDRVRALVKIARVPVFLLTRRLQDVWPSYVLANQTGIWGRNVAKTVPTVWEEGEGSLSKEPLFMEFERMVQAYFESIRGLLREEGAMFDEFRYEDVAEAEFVYASNARCYIKNCNFQKGE